LPRHGNGALGGALDFLSAPATIGGEFFQSQ
jgi:hypothetical protein